MSIAESRTIPALVETGRITNVDIERWSVNAVSEHGGKHWFDMQVASPYFHYMNGEGIYTVSLTVTDVGQDTATKTVMPVS